MKIETGLPKKDAGWDILHTDGPFRIMGTDTGIKSADISFINAIEGWAVGNSSTMLRTLDGGNTWKSVESPVDTPLIAVHFVSSEIGWVLTQDASFLSTTDGGKTWQVLNETSKPIISGYDQNSQPIEEACELYTAHFQGFGEGWAAGKEGVILHNKDGNTIWRHQKERNLSILSRHPDGGRSLRVGCRVVGKSSLDERPRRYMAPADNQHRIRSVRLCLF